MLHLLLLAPLALPLTQVDAAPESPAPPAVAITTPRAFLGVQISQAEGLGLRVDRVVAGSAAEAAGLQVGDVLAAFNGTDLSQPEQLLELIGAAGVGAEVRLSVLREDAAEDAAEELTATLRGAPEPVAVEEQRVDGPSLDFLREVQVEGPEILELKADLEALQGQLRELRSPADLALAPDERPFLGVYLGDSEGPGIRLEGTVEGSGAATAGMTAGDRLISVGGSMVDDLDSLRAVLERYAVGDSVEVTVERGDRSLDLLVELGGRPVEFEGFELDDVAEFDDFMEFEGFEVEFDGDGQGESEGEGPRTFFFELEDGQQFDAEEWMEELNHRVRSGDAVHRSFEWNVGKLPKMGDGTALFLRSRPDGSGQHFEWREIDGQRGLEADMPEWAREMRREMDEWRRQMERDMQSLRQRLEGPQGWSARPPAPDVPRMFRLRTEPGPQTRIERVLPDRDGTNRYLEIEELRGRSFNGGGAPRFFRGEGSERAERREVHVDADGRRTERRFRGVRNGDGWDWTPLEGDGRDLGVDIDRAVDHALRLHPEVRRNGQEIEVEVHVEHEAGHGHDHGGDGGGPGDEIEALKRRLDELEAQRAELREQLKQLKQRR